MGHTTLTRIKISYGNSKKKNETNQYWLITKSIKIFNSVQITLSLMVVLLNRNNVLTGNIKSWDEDFVFFYLTVERWIGWRLIKFKNITFFNILKNHMYNFITSLKLSVEIWELTSNDFNSTLEAIRLPYICKSILFKVSSSVQSQHPIIFLIFGFL